jgi:hypothetical protein
MLLSLSAAVPPLDEESTSLQKPLWLSVCLEGGYGQVAIRPGIDFQIATFSQGRKRTVSGRLNQAKDKYVGTLKIVEWRSESDITWAQEVGVSLALDKPQTSNSFYHRLGDPNIDLIVSHERDKWIKIWRKNAAAATEGGPGRTGPVPQ